MSSRAEEKRRAREAREAQERAAEAGARRRRRLLTLGGVLAAAAIVLVVAIAASRAGSGSEPPPPQEAQALLAGIPQDGPWLGRPDAPIVVEEYVDMQCPFCGQFARDVLPDIVADEVRNGEIRIRQRILTFLGDASVTAGRTVVAAGLQDRQWAFSDLFFAEQGEENTGYVTDDFLNGLGADVQGLDMERVREQRASGDVTQRLEEDRKAAASRGIDATPTFVAGRRGGELRELQLQALTPDGFRSALEQAVGQR
jgi:protein-disulfide isomerase